MPASSFGRGDMVANGVDVAQLSDDELYQKLKDLGMDVGPIVDTTRSVYERKLYQLLLNGDSYLSNQEQHHDVYNHESYHEEQNYEYRQEEIYENSRLSDHVEMDTTPSRRKPLHSQEVKPTTKGTPTPPSKKDSSFFVSCFEIVMLTFLAVVGYIFIQEIRTYSAAEQEFEESHAQNFEGYN